MDHCGPASFSLGVTLAFVYLFGILVAYFFPSFYTYLGYVLFHGAISVTIGDFTVTTVLAGIVTWFLIGMLINGVYYYAKRIFKYK